MPDEEDLDLPKENEEVEDGDEDGDDSGEEEQ